MIIVLALMVSAQPAPAPARDSGERVRLLASLRTADSTVCELAGRAITNFGGFWNWESDPPMPMPMPMPTPMPMPFGPGISVGPRIHGGHWGKLSDPGTLAVFRGAVRDQNRCVRQLSARVIGNSRPAWAYDLFANQRDGVAKVAITP